MNTEKDAGYLARACLGFGAGSNRFVLFPTHTWGSGLVLGLGDVGFASYGLGSTV